MKQMTVKAETADRNDIPGLCRMRLAYLAEDTGLSDEQRDEISETLPGYFEKNLNRNIFCYVVREDGMIVSSAFLLIVEKPMSPSFMNGRTGTVLNVYTMPAYRKKGYASMMMDKLIEGSKEMGLCRVDLKATEAGLPLYRSKGFKEDQSHYVSMKYIIG